MPIPVDKELYDVVKEYVMSRYKKSSAYSSGAIVKNYKLMFQELYGDKEPYYDDKKEKKLKRWYSEKWVDVNPLINKSGYALYRPTKKINSQTPTLLQDIPVSRLEELSDLKQKYKGNKNLPKFKN